MVDTRALAQQLQAVTQQAQFLSMQILSLRREVYGLRARERARSAGRTPRHEIEFKAQFGEDTVIADLLGHPDKGFYIECGAFDGVSFSVTYALDAMGWDGVLIEAIPQRAEECRRSRPAARTVHAALGTTGGGTIKFAVAQDAFGGMLSSVVGSDHFRTTIEGPKLPYTVAEVPLLTMNDVLAGHEGPIDVAVLDVEGAEIPLLKGFDLVRWKPRVMVIEDNDMFTGDLRLKNYMAQQPYIEVAQVAVNRVYVHKDETEILKRARG